MNKVLRYLGQAIIYAAVAVLLAYFADSPSYQRLPEGHALVKLSFAHGADRKGGCRQLSREEMAKLPRSGPVDFFAAVAVPCLLYTSPSPRDSGESRMPSSA